MEPIDAKKAWDLEYSQPQLLTKADLPTKEFREFVKWLTKEKSFDFNSKTVIDLGCGNGRNLIYLAENYLIKGMGFDISKTALEIASGCGLKSLTWKQIDIGKGLDLEKNSVDVVIDSTSSHLVPLKERLLLIKSLWESLKTGGYIYVRTLISDGDKNAHNLMKLLPGPEKSSYIHPRLGVVEYVLPSRDVMGLYKDGFVPLYTKKYLGYQKWGNQSYKRKYMVLYLQKT